MSKSLSEGFKKRPDLEKQLVKEILHAIESQIDLTSESSQLESIKQEIDLIHSELHLLSETYDKVFHALLDEIERNQAAPKDSD